MYPIMMDSGLNKCEDSSEVCEPVVASTARNLGMECLLNYNIAVLMSTSSTDVPTSRICE